MNKMRNNMNKSRRKRKVVIMDTDIIIHSLENKIDFMNEIIAIIEHPVKLCVTSSTLRELEKMAKRGSWRISRIANIALNLLKKKSIEVIDDEYLGELSTDEKIAILAEKLEGIVATDDRELRKKLKEKGIPVIYVREESKLVLDRNIYW